MSRDILITEVLELLEMWMVKPGRSRDQNYGGMKPKQVF